MPGRGVRLPLTLRRWRGPLGIWVLATAAGTVAGPFGTFDALDWPGRAAYWGAVAAVAVGFSVLLHRLHRARLRGGRAWGWALDLVYAVVLGGGVHALNVGVFDGWGGWGDYLWLVGLILAMALALEALRMLFAPRPAAVPATAPRGAPGAAPDAAVVLRGLPPDKRGPLVRIEAQDHYLLVVTEAGQDLVLMRMADAEAALGPSGLRVHRSHWVARRAVRDLRRDGGRWRLALADGAEVPVSRAHRAAVAAAGLGRDPG